MRNHQFAALLHFTRLGVAIFQLCAFLLSLLDLDTLPLGTAISTPPRHHWKSPQTFEPRISNCAVASCRLHSDPCRRHGTEPLAVLPTKHFHRKFSNDTSFHKIRKIDLISRKSFCLFVFSACMSKTFLNFEAKLFSDGARQQLHSISTAVSPFASRTKTSRPHFKSSLNFYRLCKFHDIGIILHIINLFYQLYRKGCPISIEQISISIIIKSPLNSHTIVLY